MSIHDQRQSLVDAQWLKRNVDIPNLVLLDATLAKVGKDLPPSYGQVCIPKTRVFDLKNSFIDTDAVLPNSVPSPARFQQQARQIGVNNDSKVVVYDHHGVYSSPRAWWLFKLMGHERIFVLDGGFPAWQAANLPVEEPVEYSGESGDFTAEFDPGWIATAEHINQSLGSNEQSVIDARSAKRFLAQIPEPRPGVRGGHIPGSSNLPVSNLTKEGQLLPASELNQLFSAIAQKDQDIVCTCGSGITACTIALAAHSLGYQKLAVFDGSWAEWGANENLPIEP